MAVSESDITSYITHLLDTIGKKTEIDRVWATEHIVKHFRTHFPHHNVLIIHGTAHKHELVDATHRRIDVPWPASPSGSIAFDLYIFKSGTVTFEQEELRENVFYDGKFVKNDKKIEFSTLEPVDP